MTSYMTIAQRHSLIEDAVGIYSDDRDAMNEFGGEHGIRCWLAAMSNSDLYSLIRSNGWLDLI
jgi:hypothetical protein